MSYAELHCLSHFSFGRGAASAKELFVRAKAMGYRALAITDECTLAGAVRALEAARETDMKLIIGSEFVLQCGLKLVLIVHDLAGYHYLSALITSARRSASKGSYCLARADFSPTDHVTAIWLANYQEHDSLVNAQATWLRSMFAGHLALGIALHREATDAHKLERLQALAQRYAMLPVACGDVHMDVRAKRLLQDTLTAIRHRCTIAEAGAHLFQNGERHLRNLRALRAIYPAELLANTLVIAQRCQFDLGSLRYQYPRELVPRGHTPTSWLRALTESGARWRWPNGVHHGAAARVQTQLEHELTLIAELGYEAFFLTVHDVVRFARSQGILCQGRGSAANSAVCFVLGITELDPAHYSLLFERFISKERNEPPDIDVDFEHERREEVIQYIYRKYGRERAALAATVICYRSKSAVRDVAKALGLPGEQLDQLSQCFSWWDKKSVDIDTRLRERGFDPHSRLIQRIITLAMQLKDAPRHLSQHVGGFVISDAPLSQLVPVENAAMVDRTIIQWDKDDLETLGLLKVDCLALGMLSCLRRCFDLLRTHQVAELSIAQIAPDDAATYQMIQRADTVGVFQIESRAQMSMLPRLKPRCFYDLVIEVAIVRPGPIQGNMVHPYLRRRQALEPVTYPSDDLKKVFERTLGVPLFQEQVMQLAVVAAGFTPGEADQLRRSMAAWQRRGGLEHFQQRIISGMLERGYTSAFAEQVFEQIKGFGSYGFPESHAASFALLTYASCYLKCHYPAAFCCALLNAQPLGFYSNSQLLQDARRHGIAVHPVDVRFSDWDCSLEAIKTQSAHKTQGAHPSLPKNNWAIRLGFRVVLGFAADAARRIVAARTECSFNDIEDVVLRAELNARERDLLARANAFKALAGHRHRAYWQVAAIQPQLPLFAEQLDPHVRAQAELPLPSVSDDMYADLRSTHISVHTHPLQLVRKQLRARRCIDARNLQRYPHGKQVRVAGLVTLRQRPGTASGVTFLTLEDEFGCINIVVWKQVADEQRRTLLESSVLCVEGRFESVDGVQHVIARQLSDYSAILPAEVPIASRDFH